MSFVLFLCVVCAVIATDAAGVILVFDLTSLFSRAR